MYEKILVPLDGSPLAEAALPGAEELAGRLGSEIILLSISESTEAEDYLKYQIYTERKVEEVRKHARKYLDKSADKDVTITPVVLVGHSAEEIIRYANRADIDLIVMTTHGSSGIKRWALGRMADKVVRATDHPVALIRARTPYSEIARKSITHKALVSLDGSEASEAVLPYIQEFARRLRTEVTLVQVVTRSYRVFADAESYLEKVKEQFQSHGITANSVVRMGAAAEEIIKVADEMKTDIVAMSTHGRSGIGRWSIGSVADKVLRGGNTPVLLVRTPGTATG